MIPNTDPKLSIVTLVLRHPQTVEQFFTPIIAWSIPAIPYTSPIPHTPVNLPVIPVVQDVPLGGVWTKEECETGMCSPGMTGKPKLAPREVGAVLRVEHLLYSARYESVYWNGRSPEYLSDYVARFTHCAD